MEPENPVSCLITRQPNTTQQLTALKALLKAIAEKLIPGIPEACKIVILQQSRLTEEDESPKSDSAEMSTLTTLQEIIERATSRNIVEKEIKSR